VLISIYSVYIVTPTESFGSETNQRPRKKESSKENELNLAYKEIHLQHQKRTVRNENGNL
jgi:hypothetical protein